MTTRRMLDMHFAITSRPLKWMGPAYCGTPSKQIFNFYWPRWLLVADLIELCDDAPAPPLRKHFIFVCTLPQHLRLPHIYTFFLPLASWRRHNCTTNEKPKVNLRLSFFFRLPLIVLRRLIVFASKLFGLIYPDSASDAEGPRDHSEASFAGTTTQPQTSIRLFVRLIFPAIPGWKSKNFMFQVRSLLNAEVGLLKTIWLRSKRKWFGWKKNKGNQNTNECMWNCENALNAFPFRRSLSLTPSVSLSLSLLHCNQSVGQRLWKIAWFCWPGLPTSNYPELQSAIGGILKII